MAIEDQYHFAPGRRVTELFPAGSKFGTGNNPATFRARNAVTWIRRARCLATAARPTARLEVPPPRRHLGRARRRPGDAPAPRAPHLGHADRARPGRVRALPTARRAGALQP